MKNYIKAFISVVLISAGLTFVTSCEDDCTADPVESCNIPIEIMKDEMNVIVRFRIPENNKTEKISFSGRLYEYLEPQTVETVYFTIDGTDIAGNIKRFLLKSAGEPVPGAEIFAEQEPDEPPIASTTTDKEGTFNIVIDKILPAGTYSIRVSPANTDKGGFAVGGYRID